MRKPSKKGANRVRLEYKRSDFGSFVRGKYARRVATTANVVVRSSGREDHGESIPREMEDRLDQCVGASRPERIRARSPHVRARPKG